MFGGDGGDGVFLGEIGDDDVRRHIVAAGDQFGELIEPVAAACDEDEVMAALRKRQREMRAEPGGCAGDERRGHNRVSVTPAFAGVKALSNDLASTALRSAERRGGKECVSRCRTRGSPYYYKKK